jgi:DNA-binding GntR family transcriptional regulator
MPPPSQNPSATDRLRDDLVSGEYEPGARLVEQHLTQRYGVGRASVRAAILELAKEGLVVHEANRGARVRIRSLEETIEIYEVRARLEGLLARSAAQNATAANLEALRRRIRELGAALERGGGRRFLEGERALYEELARSARHRVAGELMATLRNQSGQLPERLSQDPGWAAAALEEHSETIAAIESGDADAAEQAARGHVESILERLR